MKTAETIGSHKDKLTILGKEKFEEKYITRKMNTGKVFEHFNDHFFQTSYSFKFVSVRQVFDLTETPYFKKKLVFFYETSKYLVVVNFSGSWHNAVDSNVIDKCQ